MAETYYLEPTTPTQTLSLKPTQLAHRSAKLRPNAGHSLLHTSSIKKLIHPRIVTHLLHTTPKQIPFQTRHTTAVLPGDPNPPNPKTTGRLQVCPCMAHIWQKNHTTNIVCGSSSK